METLEELLTNRRFQAKVRQAAAKTFQTGHEAGFGVWSNGRKLTLGEVIEGGCLEVAFVLLDLPQGLLHFHPEMGGAIIPSGGDLEALSWLSQTPIDWTIVGQVDEQGEVILLLLEPVHPVAVSDLPLWEEEAEDLLLRNVSQEIVNEKLASLGLKASMATVRYRLKSAA